MSIGPRSLSVVTVSPEIQNRLEMLSNQNGMIPIGGFINERDNIKFLRNEEPQQQQRQQQQLQQPEQERKSKKSPDLNYRRDSIKPPTVSTLVEDEEWTQSTVSSSNSSNDSNLRYNQETKDDERPRSILRNRYADNESIGECSMSVQNIREKSADSIMKDRTTKLLSVLYGLMIALIGVMLAVKDMTKKVNDYDHMFGIIVNTISLIYLIFLHQDIQRHKSFVMKWQKKRKDQIEKSFKLNGMEDDQISITTVIIFNRTFQDNMDDVEIEIKDKLNFYKFQKGKHSGNFYLKIGMTLFCMGSIVHQGVSLAPQVHFYNKGIDDCQNAISVTIYAIRCIVAFYELYMAYKYSNLIINRYKTLAMFGFMHTLGSSISFWFSTIIEEAMDGYTKKMRDIKYINSTHIIPAYVIEYKHMCQNMTTLQSVENWPYLYPFSIEYNIILASVFYIMWTNIGNKSADCELSYIREEVKTDHSTGAMEVNYHSNVTITADCHGSNLGLFSGLMSLLTVLASTIVFFSTVSNDKFHDFGVEIYTFQFGILTISLLFTITIASLKIRKLNVSHHLDSASTTMDDFLLILPLPFFFIFHIMCINSNIQSRNMNDIILAVLHLIDLIQVVYQSLFLIDGIRRCSNDRKYRFYKPGKGLVTFSIITNVAYWLLGTFEMKTVDKYHSMNKYYGKFEWMIVLDSCLPLMLFYRFHSSVCLSDIWKNAYEKDEKHH